MMTAKTEHQKDDSNPKDNTGSRMEDFSVKEGKTVTGEKKGTVDQLPGSGLPGSSFPEGTTGKTVGGDDKPTGHDESAERETEDPLVTLANDLKQAHAQKEELQNQLLRSVAEMENLRKRTQREISDSRQFAITAFARDLLNVADNLWRAIDTASQQETEVDSKGLKNLLEGVCMTERELSSVLEKHKVRKTPAMGEKFDPNFHQAMFEVPNTEVPSNTVMEVVQEGYVIGERMLRPAMVGVSKGGPKSSGAETDSPEGSGATDSSI